MYLYTYVHIYMYIHIYVYMHIYIYTYVYAICVICVHTCKVFGLVPQLSGQFSAQDLATGPA